LAGQRITKDKAEDKADATDGKKGKRRSRPIPKGMKVDARDMGCI
jgi:hypothetical protein